MGCSHTVQGCPLPIPAQSFGLVERQRTAIELVSHDCRDDFDVATATLLNEAASVRPVAGTAMRTSTQAARAFVDVRLRHILALALIFATMCARPGLAEGPTGWGGGSKTAEPSGTGPDSTSWAMTTRSAETTLPAPVTPTTRSLFQPPGPSGREARACESWTTTCTTLDRTARVAATRTRFTWQAFVTPSSSTTASPTRASASSGRAQPRPGKYRDNITVDVGVPCTGGTDIGNNN
jgi:hypothetical protein